MREAALLDDDIVRLDQQLPDVAPLPEDMCYAPSKLHDRSRLCWAVVGYPSGAIAQLSSGALLMRLPEQRALSIALALTLSPLPGRTRH